MKFSDLKQGDVFWPLDGYDDEIYMKIEGEALSNIINEGEGGHAVLLADGSLCFFHEHEEIECNNVFKKFGM